MPDPLPRGYASPLWKPRKRDAQNVDSTAPGEEPK
jgi:hypothetical protein